MHFSGTCLGLAGRIARIDDRHAPHCLLLVSSNAARIERGVPPHGGKVQALCESIHQSPGGAYYGFARLVGGDRIEGWLRILLHHELDGLRRLRAPQLPRTVEPKSKPP